MWPKLLRSSSTEAMADRTKAKDAAAPTVAAVKKSLTDGEGGTEKSKTAAGQTAVTRKDSGKVLLFETRDPKAGDEWIHRSYVVK